MIPRFKPHYDFSDWVAAFSFHKKAVVNYEQLFSAKFGCNHGVMFSYGRTGIYALLKTWGLSGVEVICPAYTCVVVANAIVLSGNTPVFVDCEKDGFNMDLEGIEKAITKNTRVVVPTHIFGYPMNVVKVQQIVEAAEIKYGNKIYVIQDCAHSFGARFNGDLVSTYGDAAIFGANISKIINSIYGGMVITNDEMLARKLRKWREENAAHASLRKSLKRLMYFIAVSFAFNNIIYSLVNWMERNGVLDYFVKYYDENIIDLPKDWLDAPVELEARVGISQLKKYDSIVAARRIEARQLIEEMQSYGDVSMPAYNCDATYSHIVAVVDNKDEWIEKYRKKGMQLGEVIEYSIPMLKSYRVYCKKRPEISYFYSRHIINFPIA